MAIKSCPWIKGKGKIEKYAEFQKEFGIKSATFKASPIAMRDVSVVDYKGKLLIYDIEYGKEKYKDLKKQ